MYRPANLNTSSGEVEPLGGNSLVNDEATDNSAFLNRLAQRRPPSVPQTLTVDTVVDNVLYFGRVYAHFLGIELETAGSTITETGRAAGDFFGDHISQAYYDPSAEAERVKRAAISTAVGASNAAQYIYNNPTQALSAAGRGTVNYLDRLTSDPTVSGQLLGNYAVSTALFAAGGATRQATGHLGRLRAPRGVPQGLTPRQFDRISAQIRSKADELGLGSDIVVQGSRARGTARATSDIDIGIRVSPDDFGSIMNNRRLTTLSNPNPGSSLSRTRQFSLDNGIIQSGEARLSRLRQALENDLGIEVDLSILRRGGAFDNGPKIPLSFGF